MSTPALIPVNPTLLLLDLLRHALGLPAGVLKLRLQRSDLRFIAGDQRELLLAVALHRLAEAFQPPHALLSALAFCVF